MKRLSAFLIAACLLLPGSAAFAQTKIYPAPIRFGVSIAPTTNDVAALGTADLGWSDLFLAPGAVINAGNGEFTLTFAANRLTVAGGDILLPDGTNSLPTLRFSQGDGIYSSSGTSIDISIGGVRTYAFQTAKFFPATNALASLGDAALGWKALYLDYTNTATVGAVTIDKPVMRVNIAAGGTSVVVTNSLVTAASHVFCLSSKADSTARVTDVVPTAGSFTMRTVATTAETSFDCLVINAD